MGRRTPQGPRRPAPDEDLQVGSRPRSQAGPRAPDPACRAMNPPPGSTEPQQALRGQLCSTPNAVLQLRKKARFAENTPPCGDCLGSRRPSSPCFDSVESTSNEVEEWKPGSLQCVRQKELRHEGGAREALCIPSDPASSPDHLHLTKGLELPLRANAHDDRQVAEGVECALAPLTPPPDAPRESGQHTVIRSQDSQDA